MVEEQYGREGIELLEKIIEEQGKWVKKKYNVVFCNIQYDRNNGRRS